MAKQNEIEVFCLQFMDKHDDRYVMDRAAENPSTHIYTHAGFLVVSDKPLSPRKVKQAVIQDQIEQAREALKDGVSLGEVWQSRYISAANVSRTAKEEAIERPRGW